MMSQLKVYVRMFHHKLNKPLWVKARYFFVGNPVQELVKLNETKTLEEVIMSRQLGLDQPGPTQMAYWAKNCHCLNQGRTLNNLLMRAAHWMAYFDLKLNLAYTNVMKAFES